MPKTRPTKIVAYMHTDIGMVRDHNEDTGYADPDNLYFVVADGMGGHAAGEVASALAVEEVKKAITKARKDIAKYAKKPGEESRNVLVKLLETAVKQAHKTVSEEGANDPDKHGMGTTLEVMLVCGDEAIVAHVGDSRTYLLRKDRATRVTTDHTVAEVLVIEGRLSPEEARISPLRTILINAIGVSEDVGVELAHIKLREGDKLLICSDGLHDYFLEDGELATLLSEKGGDEGLKRLVEMAKERGGHDNITGILIEVIEGNPSLDDLEEDAVRRTLEIKAQSAVEATEELAIPEIVVNEPTIPVSCADESDTTLDLSSESEEDDDYDPQEHTKPGDEPEHS